MEFIIVRIVVIVYHACFPFRIDSIITIRLDTHMNVICIYKYSALCIKIVLTALCIPKKTEVNSTFLSFGCKNSIFKPF